MKSVILLDIITTFALSITKDAVMQSKVLLFRLGPEDVVMR